MSILYHRLNHDDYNQSSFQSPFTTHVTNLQCAFKRALENKFLKLMLLGLFLFNFAQGQKKSEDYLKFQEVLPPSPEASSLGKYGGLDLSLSSGAITKNISLYTYQSGKLQLPISISYYSNGFRVDELPGRLATGWSLNAGGVITRTVYGAADEMSTRPDPPRDFPSKTSRLIDFMEKISNNDQADGQPDIFSFNFNGYRGKFILDKDMNPVLLEHSNLKIERDFSSTLWNFKITTEDGVQYFFGGDVAKETTTRISTCSPHLINKSCATGWYLTKILHPNSECITLSYDYLGFQYSTGITQTIYRPTGVNTVMSVGYVPTPPSPEDLDCESILQTSGKMLLSQINSTSGGILKFSYVSRLDGGERLLSSIDLYDVGTTTSIKSFNLNYVYAVASGFKNKYSIGNKILNYRPFLASVIEKVPTGAALTHSFTYIDINGLPPRLSFAQDHFGFFNGKDNAGLIPKPTPITYQLKIPNAVADRSFDPVFSSKGLLSTIKYPTSGIDSIVYEGNQVYKQVEIDPPSKWINASTMSTTWKGGGTTVYSPTAPVSFGQQVLLSGQCSYFKSVGGYPLHDWARINVTDESGGVIYAIELRPGETIYKPIDLQSGHTYKIKVNTTGEFVTGSASFFYSPGNKIIENRNVNSGGVRVTKVITFDKQNSIANVKRYLYESLNRPLISTGLSKYGFTYEKFSNFYTFNWISSDALKGIGGYRNCIPNSYQYLVMSSNTSNNIFISTGGATTYGTVLESFGENFDNGGIEHQYTVESDKPGNAILGDGLSFGMPSNDYSWKNGREISKLIFQKNGNNVVPIEKTLTSYKEDTRIEQNITAYIANKKHDLPCPGMTDYYGAYDLYTYIICRRWVYADTIKHQLFNRNNANYIETISANEYSNVDHALLTKMSSKTSDGQSLITKYSYPQDLVLTGSEETARQSLVSNHVLNPVLKIQNFKNSIPIQSTSISYQLFPNGLASPSLVKNSNGGLQEEPLINFEGYDSKGNLLSQSKVSGVKTIYLYSYSAQYPIAEIKNSDYQAVENILGAAAIKNFSNLSSPDKATVDAFLAPLRTNLPNAHITTYTYKPLVGMTSMTDAKGMTTYYEYDAFGRLRYVKDQNGNITKSNDYHYKN